MSLSVLMGKDIYNHSELYLLPVDKRRFQDKEVFYY